MFNLPINQRAVPAAPHRNILILFTLIVWLTGPSAALAQDVANNTLTIDDVVTGIICGNTSGTNKLCKDAYTPRPGSPDSVHNNTVIVEPGGTAAGSVVGGISRGDGSVAENEVYIRGTVMKDAIGGFDYGAGNTAAVHDNALSVSGTVGLSALSGYSMGSGDVTHNILLISGTVGKDAQGGYSEGGGDVKFNTVTIKDGGSVGENAYGGTGSALVMENSLTIKGTVGKDAYGGYSYKNGMATGNTLTVTKSGTVTGDARGGFSEDGSATDNALTVDGTVEGEAYGGSGSGIVTKNVLTITGTVEQNAYGGASFGVGAATGNTLTIGNTGTVGQVAAGGYGEGSGDVSGNSLTVDGTAGDDVYGGYGQGTGSVAGNTLTISNDVKGSAYGGYIGNPSSSAGAVNNTISLKAGSSVGGGLYGGYTAGSGDARSGNTLIVGKAFTGSVKEVQNFTRYDFDMADRRAGETIIAVTGPTPSNLAGATLNLRNLNLRDVFSQGGEELVLIDQTSNGAHLDQTLDEYVNLSQLFKAQLTGEGRLVISSFKGVEANPQTKALNQGPAAAGETLRRGQDTLVGPGLYQAEMAALQCPGRLAPFASADYGDYRVNTGGGSHNDIRGWSGLVGLAWKPGSEDESGWLTGLFFETGNGRYDARNSFANVDSVKSSGDVNYYGGGLFARYRFENQLRIEASARYGKTETEYKAGGWVGGARPRYDLNTDYYGAHLGLGYGVWSGDRANLDLSLQYLWTRQESGAARVLGEKVRFNDYNSSRLRAGGRLQVEAAPEVKPFLGLFGEYEFDGKASSRNLTVGESYGAIKARGATGIAEVGVSIIPAGPCGLRLDLSVNGHFGEREGWGGQAALILPF